MRKTLALLIFFSSIFFINQHVVAAEKYVVEDLSPWQMDYINMALKRTAGVKVLQTATLKSHNHPKAYYVAARLTAPGINEPMIAVWLMTGAKVKPSSMSSVNATAYEFSRLCLGNRRKAATSLSDREYQSIMSCFPIPTATLSIVIFPCRLKKQRG